MVIQVIILDFVIFDKSNRVINFDRKAGITLPMKGGKNGLFLSLKRRCAPGHPPSCASFFFMPFIPAFAA